VKLRSSVQREVVWGQDRWMCDVKRYEIQKCERCFHLSRVSYCFLSSLISFKNSLTPLSFVLHVGVLKVHFLWQNVSQGYHLCMGYWVFIYSIHFCWLGTSWFQNILMWLCVNTISNSHSSFFISTSSFLFIHCSSFLISNSWQIIALHVTEYV